MLVANGPVAWRIWPFAVRRAMLRWLGVDIGVSRVRPHVYFGSPRVRIASDSGINTGTFFDGDDDVSIGRNCAIGQNVLFLTGSHEIADEK